MAHAKAAINVSVNVIKEFLRMWITSVNLNVLRGNINTVDSQLCAKSMNNAQKYRKRFKTLLTSILF